MKKNISFFVFLIILLATSLSAQTNYACSGGGTNQFAFSGNISYTVTPTGNGNCSVVWTIPYTMNLTGTWWNAQVGMHCGGTQSNFIHSAYPSQQSGTWNFTYQNVNCTSSCLMKYTMFGPEGNYQGTCVTLSLSALPIELEQFSAQAGKGSIHLKWATASERQNAGFEIERAAGVSDWQSIGFVEGAGDSDEPLTYSFTDPYPLPGINYYRLKQVDEIGDFTYSQIAFVEYKGESTLQLSPNPATDQVVITGGGALEKMEIYTLDGSLVKSVVQPVQNAVSCTDLPAGHYYLRVATLTDVYSFKFVKQ